MNDLRDELSNILEALDRQGLLKHVILIGSWALVIYEEYFKDCNYSPTIRTTRKRSDIELLRSLFGQLTKKQKKTVLDSAKKRVFLEDALKELVGI